jgi:hypothetical protein
MTRATDEEQTSLARIKALAFDTGGTVLNWHSGIRSALSTAGERHGLLRDWAGITNEYRRRSLQWIMGQVEPALTMSTAEYWTSSSKNTNLGCCPRPSALPLHDSGIFWMLGPISPWHLNACAAATWRCRQLRLLISDVFAGHRGVLFWAVESPAIPARVTESRAGPRPGHRFGAGVSLRLGYAQPPADPRVVIHPG